MKLVYTLIVAPTLLLLSTALANPISDAQQTARGSLYGTGQGLAAAVVMVTRPNRVERVRATSETGSFERWYFAKKGLRVVVLKFQGNDFVLPDEVEVTSQASLRNIDHDFPTMKREDLIATYGAPDSQTASTLHYNGLSEICSDSMDIALKDEKIISIKWNFCVD